MEGFDPTVMMAGTALLMPVIGAFMAITPYLMRRGEVFTVTVPTSEQHDPYVVGLKRRYAVIVGSQRRCSRSSASRAPPWATQAACWAR